MKIENLSSEVLHVAANHPKTELICNLNVLDYFDRYLVTRFAYVYKNEANIPVDIAMMKGSLQKTLNEFPELTGSVQIDERIKLIYNNKGVLFITCNANICYDDVKNITKEDRNKLYASEASFQIEDSYKCRIKCTLLEDKSFVLGVSLSHALMDGHGSFWFMNAWSHNFDNAKNKRVSVSKYTNSDIVQRQLITGSDITPYNYLDVHRLDESEIEWYQPNDLQPEEFVISKAKLKYWKDKYLNCRHENKPEFISSNDIVGAIFFKAIIKAKNLKADEAAKFGEIVNFRKHFGLENNYTGNCVIPICVKNTVHNFNKMDICELACLIRTELNALNKYKIQSTLAYIERASSWKSIKSNFDRRKDVFFVSWEGFPIFDITFGCGIANEFIYPNQAYSVLVSLPLPNKDFIKINLNLAKDQIQCVHMDEEILKILL